MAQAMPRRVKTGSGGMQWVLMGGGALLVLSATFAVGVVVGRKWEHRAEAEQFMSEARKAAATPRRSGLTDTGAAPERPQEKLTFYQTLPAPVVPMPAPAVPVKPVKPEPPKPRAAPERPAPERPVTATPVSAPKPDRALGVTPVGPARPDRPMERAAPPRLPEPARAGDWTVQVGVFKDRGQAESVRRPLAAAGYDTYLTAVPAPDGQMRYKVRTGSFKTREDAARTAQRVRQEQALTPFVTTK